MPRITVSGVFKYLREFCNETTLHGLIHVVTPRRHWCERAVWVSLLIASVFGSCWIVASSWDRYSNNPTVISIEKDYRSWLTAFPAGTICFKEKVDEEKAATAIKRIWNETDGEKFDYYMTFIKSLAKSTLEDMTSLQTFQNDNTLKDVNLLDLLLDVLRVRNDITANSYSLGGKLSFLQYNWSATEVGFCQSVSSPMAYQYSAALSPKRAPPVLWKSIPYCDFLGSACIQSTGLSSSSGEVYNYSPFEVADMFTPKIDIEAKIRMKTVYESQSFTSSPDIRKLWPKQRRCYFHDENVYENMPGYSYNICRMHCRQQLILQHCGCLPHFYPKKKGQPVCDIAGLICVAKNVSFTTDTDENVRGGKNQCKCYPPCEEFVYFEQETSSSPFFITSYSSQMSYLGKTRYSRGIIFEFSDLLVSFGGTAALFLGCSLITGVEIIYFFTIRLCRLVGRKAKSGRDFVRTTFAQNITFRSGLMAKHTAKISTAKMY